MIVREATIDDLDKLLEFEQGIVAAERPLNPTLKDGEIHYYDLAEFVESSDTGVFVVDDGGELIASGYAQVRKSKDYLKHGHHAYLGFMYVKPEHRGRGVNKLILEALLAWSHARGLHEFRLDVYSDNANAIRAYEKAGFAPHLLEMRMSTEAE